MIRKFSIAAVLLALTVILLWNVTGDMESSPPLLSADTNTGPDYSMNDFTLTVTNKKGELDYKLDAKHMDHFIDRNLTELRKPNIQFFRDTGGVWNINAKSGVIQGEHNNVLLEGKVLITLQGLKKATQITTANLQVNPGKKTAQTDEKVEILDALGKVTATGMRADLASNQLLLKANVQGRYSAATGREP